MADIRIVPSLDFATASLDAFLELVDEFPSPAVGLATGNTPLGLYHALGRAVMDGAVSVGQVRPFAIDEYVVARHHPCSNREFFERHWETIEDAAPVAQFDPEAPDLAAEAARFAAALAAAGGLDVAVLGIGTNGHLAFNEPGSTAECRARVVELADGTREAVKGCFGAESPRAGLTLGMAELLGARAVLLLANGASKAGVVARALRGVPSPECPASLLQGHERLLVVLDEDAARALD
ncbi:MAG: 6-phosphogluconolactonase [Dehalococcoidia bacterium]|nr:6-phosphogluconolactonase [Dehalococcoidia bacterium]